MSEGRRSSAVKIDFNDQASRFSRTLFTIIYIKPRATFIWGFSPNVCTLPLQSCCSFYYQGDILSRSRFWTGRFYVSPLSSSTRQDVFYSLSFIYIFFLYIFSLCRSLSIYIRVNETLLRKVALNLAYNILPIFHSEKTVVVWHISFPIFF